MKIKLLGSAAVVAGLILLVMPVTAATTAIVGGTIVNLDGKKALQDAVILVEGERIAAIGSRSQVEIPPGTQIVDAAGQWLIPGMMNMHVHLDLILPGKMQAELATETEAAAALRMASNAGKILQAGVTTVRLPGSERGLL